MPNQCLPSFAQFSAIAVHPHSNDPHHEDIPVIKSKVALPIHFKYDSSSLVEKRTNSSSSHHISLPRMHTIIQQSKTSSRQILNVGQNIENSGQDTNSSPISSQNRYRISALLSCPVKRRKVRERKKYLRDYQRIEIVQRVFMGEKQAHLAKEFNVSRAAVCYLLKHHEEIVQRTQT